MFFSPLILFLFFILLIVHVNRAQTKQNIILLHANNVRNCKTQITHVMVITHENKQRDVTLVVLAS